MTLEIAKQDLDFLLDSQRAAFHDWPPEKDARINSQNFYQHDQCAWNTPIIFKMVSSGNGKTREYTVDKNMHKIVKAKFIQPLYTLEVKADQRNLAQICLSHNSVQNIIESGTMIWDTTQVGYIDSVTQSIEYQYFREEKKEREENTDHGNVPMFEDWSSVIPAGKISTELKFGFARHVNTGFPLYRCEQLPTRINLTLKREVASLIRLRWRTSEKDPWTIVDGLDTVTLSRYVNGLNSTGELPEPEVIGSYVFMSQREIGDSLCDHKNLDKDGHELPYSMWYHDWVPVEVNTKMKYGNTFDVPIKCEFPCLGVFVQAENQTAVARHNYSNGTTDPDNVYKGYTPLAQVRFRQGTQHRFTGFGDPYIRGTTKEDRDRPGISAEILNELQRDQYPSSPTVFGYTSVAFGRMMDIRENRTTQVFTGNNVATLSIKLGNCDPYLKPALGSITHSDKKLDLTFTPNNDEFGINVRLLVLREIRFSVDKSGKQKVEYL